MRNGIGLKGFMYAANTDTVMWVSSHLSIVSTMAMENSYGPFSQFSFDRYKQNTNYINNTTVKTIIKEKTMMSTV